MRLAMFSITLMMIVGTIYSDTVVWSGKVNADGTPSKVVPLTLGKKYIIKVSGIVNLGKWWQQGKPLAEDACYEFNAELKPEKYNTFSNSLHISVCDGTYHADHVYQSSPFMAAQSGIHFWVYDTDYSNNSGSLDVQVIEVN